MNSQRHELPAANGSSFSLVIGAVLLVLGLLYLGHASFYWQWLEDDAFITLRYASNVVDGQGVVFNPGEKVEGYSNFLWVMWGAAALKLGIDPAVAMRGLGILSGLFCLPLAWDLARRFFKGNSWAALVAPAILAVTPPLARHATNGLETVFFTFLFTLAMWLVVARWSLLRNGALVAVLVALALTRPEGFIFAFLFLIPFLPGKLPGFFGSSDSTGTRGVLVIVAFVVIWGAYFAWRWNYFGAVFPNTYYAKMTGDAGGLVDGLQYAADFLRDCMALPLLALAAVPLFWSRHSPKYLHLFLVLAAYLGFVVASGGDWMLVYRFFVPVLPLLAVGAAVGLGQLSTGLSFEGERAQRWRVLPVAILVAGLGALSTANFELAQWREVGPSLQSGDYLTYSYRDLGLWVAENTPEDASVAASDIGALGYFSERRIIDMFGLIDTHIARLSGKQHHKADPAYVLTQQPDFVILVRELGPKAVYLRIPDAAMWRLPAFQESYQLVSEFPMPGVGESIEVYGKR